MRVSVGTAPDRWLCKSAPFGNAFMNARSFAGLVRIVSRYRAVPTSAGDLGAIACAAGGAIANSTNTITTDSCVRLMRNAPVTGK